MEAHPCLGCLTLALGHEPLSVFKGAFEYRNEGGYAVSALEELTEEDADLFQNVRLVDIEVADAEDLAVYVPECSSLRVDRVWRNE